MPNSNYPNGFSGGVSIRNVPIMQTNPGLVFWVSNNTTGLLAGQRGGSDGNRGTFDAPFATLNYAMTQCVANRGDIIFIKPGHAETITAAGTIALANAGVAIVGLGYGSARPTFTYTTANTASIAVSAANISIQNCVFTANFLSIAAAFTLTTAKNFTVQGCTFNETSSVLNFLNCVKSTGAANTVDGLTVTDSQWLGLGTTSVNSFVLTANTIDALTLQRNTVILNRTATAAILCTVSAGILTNLDAGYNKCMSGQTATTGGCLINVGGTTSTGVYYNNYTQVGAAGGDVTVTTTVGLGAFENRHTDATGASGFVIPAADV
jgi:hypothetical protein